MVGVLDDEEGGCSRFIANVIGSGPAGVGNGGLQPGRVLAIDLDHALGRRIALFVVHFGEVDRTNGLVGLATAEELAYVLLVPTGGGAGGRAGAERQHRAEHRCDGENEFGVWAEGGHVAVVLCWDEWG